MSETLPLDARIARLRETSHPGWRGEALALIAELETRHDERARDYTESVIAKTVMLNRIGQLEAALAVAEAALEDIGKSQQAGLGIRLAALERLDQIAKRKGGA